MSAMLKSTSNLLHLTLSNTEYRFPLLPDRTDTYVFNAIMEQYMYSVNHSSDNTFCILFA